MSHASFSRSYYDASPHAVARHVMAAHDLCIAKPSASSWWSITGVDGAPIVTSYVWYAVANRMHKALPDLFEGPTESDEARDLVRRAIGILFHMYTRASPDMLAKMRGTDMPLVMRELDAAYTTLRALGVWNTPGLPCTSYFQAARVLIADRSDQSHWNFRLAMRHAQELRTVGAFRASHAAYKHIIRTQPNNWFLEADTLRFMRSIDIYHRTDSVAPTPLHVVTTLEDTNLMRRGISPLTDAPGKQLPSVPELRYPNKPYHEQLNSYLPAPEL